ncbi:MAG: RNA polymerase sigma factor [Burkholderiaceae bacterium]|jgi:RNA polymerase sigma-70 factor (ECF subfamily)|nr:RNA polymerase sigma factor [Burkholderiaceae bacterium]
MKRDPFTTTRGDLQAAPASPLAALYARWRQPLVRLLQGRLGSRAQAEDTAQQVFTQMAASGRLPEAGKEQAYLSRAARHVAIDDWRRGGADQAMVMVSAEDCGEELQAQAADAHHDPVRQAQRRQYLDRLSDALDELPARQREAFCLHIMEGLSQEEVSRRMDISLRMVSKHISRAYAYCELRLQYGSMEQMQRLKAQAADTEHAPGRGPTP